MRKRTFAILGVFVLAVLLVAWGGSAFAQAQTPTPPTQANETTPVTRTITVSGSGTAYLTPDIAHISIGVHTEGKDAAQAVDSNNTQTQKVITALKNAGIADKDIQTTNFSIYPQQQFDSQGKPTGEITYVVDNTVFVTVRNLDNIGKVLNEAVAAGANSISGIQFDVTDRTQALSDARKAAVTDAHAQAQELAQAAGVGLGPVQSINVSSSPQPPVPVAQFRAAGAAMESPQVPVQSGQLVVTVDVNIVYEIH
jgi:uncharacterized protein YggE